MPALPIYGKRFVNLWSKEMKCDLYTRYTLCSDLLYLIDEGCSSEQITKWAGEIHVKYKLNEFEPGVDNLIQNFMLFDLPEFVFTKDKLIKLCIILLQGTDIRSNNSIQDILTKN
jgi:hypothetical protein